MKAVTVCQPYAHLIATGEKRVENRTWWTSHRGPLLIHAGKSLKYLRGVPASPDMAFGAIVAVVNVVDCVSIESVCRRGHVTDAYPWLADHEHAEGPWCWVLSDVRRFEVPTPYKGAQGLWDVPSHLVPSNAEINPRICREQKPE